MLCSSISPDGSQYAFVPPPGQVQIVSATPDPAIEQARRDLAAGQVDTDLRATPGLDAQRRKDLLRPKR